MYKEYALRGDVYIMKRFRKVVCIAMTLVLAQSISVSSYAANIKAVPVRTVTTSTASAKKIVSKLYLNKTSVKLIVGKTITLKAELSTGGMPKVTWTSSNKKVVTVDGSGKVKAIGKGTANITARTSDGKSAVCTVSVITQNEAYIEEVIRLVNSERTKRGLNKLAVNSRLSAAAQKRAGETERKLSHTRPDGTSFSTVLTEYKIKYTVTGENIAYNYYTADEAMEGLMDSKGHRDNILNKRFKNIGVGLYEKDGYKYLVQLFT